MNRKVLIGTPAFGGQYTAEYVTSLVSTLSGFHRDAIDFAIYSLTNESLINRGRNTIANYVLQNKEYTHLMFIDADIGWEYADLKKLLDSDKLIVGGTYPVKAYPMSMNFNPLPEHLDFFDRFKTVEGLREFGSKYGNNARETEVLHLPTGFMCINRAALEYLSQFRPSYLQKDGHGANTMTEMVDFFPIRIKDNLLESEDWAFCSIAKEHGIKVYLNTDIMTTHSGNHVFDPKNGESK